MAGDRQRFCMRSGGGGVKFYAPGVRMIDPVPRRHGLNSAARHRALAAQCMQDTCSRTNAGIAVFLAVWLVICLIGGLWAKAPSVVLVHTLLLSVIA